jgi:hypothetical protein
LMRLKRSANACCVAYLRLHCGFDRCATGDKEYIDAGQRVFDLLVFDTLG